MVIGDTLAKAHDHPLNVAVGYSALGDMRGPDGQPVVHAGWGTPFHDRGHNVKTWDWDKHRKGSKSSWETVGLLPDYTADITALSADDFLNAFGGEPIDIAFFSPPCEGFSQQQIGQTFHQPEQWHDDSLRGKLKRQINMMRGTGEEYPEDIKWMPKNEAGARSLRTWQHTMEDIVGGLREANPDMKAVVENPQSALRYHPASFGDYDMANIQHASYQEPASSQLFGMDQFSPTPPGREYLSGGIPELKPTDLYGHFPRGWTPRPRLMTAKNPKKDVLHGTNILYANAPGSGEKRNLERDEILDLIAHGGNKDTMERLRHTPQMNPQQRPNPLSPTGWDLNEEDHWWRSKPRGKMAPGFYPQKPITTGTYGNRYYAAAPGGSNAGINRMGQENLSFRNRAGQTITPDPYFIRSLIPYGEGLDFALALEREHGLGQSPRGQAVVDPTQVREQFMRNL